MIVDSKNNKYDNILDEWMNNFCEGINQENIVCFSYSKEEEKGEIKKKVCKLYYFLFFNFLFCLIFLKKFLANQFPQLTISEVINDMKSLLPHLNKFLIKILNNNSG